MKRSDAVSNIKSIINNMSDFDITTYAAETILTKLEEMGMKPPSVDEETCQAILQVYYGGVSFNQWDEEIEKDAEVMEAKRKRAEWAAERAEKAAIRLTSKKE